jgi:hypothetical protein
MRTQVEDVSVDHAGGCVLVGNVFLAVWKSEPADLAARFRAGLTLGLRRSPGGLFHLVVLEPGMRLISDGARREVVEIVRANNEKLLGFGLCIPGEGFASAAFRAMATGMSLMAPKLRGPVKVVARVGEAAQFFATLAPTATPSELESALEDVRARMTSHGQSLSV